MQFNDIAGQNARGLMQIVDILRDDRGHFARTVQAREREMPATRLRRCKMRVHGETPAPRLIAHVGAGHELIEGNGLGFGPQAARRAEIRDTAFGRDPRPGKGLDHVGLVNQFA